jgi:hypothetical protein
LAGLIHTGNEKPLIVQINSLAWGIVMIIIHCLGSDFNQTAVVNVSTAFLC